MCFQLSDYMSLSILISYGCKQQYSFCSFCVRRRLAFWDLGVFEENLYSYV